MYESKLTKKDTKLGIDFPPTDNFRDNSERILVSTAVHREILEESLFLLVQKITL
jgi:hypothetical protein